MDGFQDLTGSEFDRADMTGARFTTVLLNDAVIRNADLHRVTMRGVEVVDTVIDGEVSNLVINGVDVAPLVEAELDRRHPERRAFRPTTVDGFRSAWELNERLWAATVARARRLHPDLLHESVDGEWSFVQTLRHLAFASESWVGRGVLGDPSPWHPLSLPWDEMPPIPGVPHDRDARPSLDEALALRERAMGLVRGVLADLTEERLAATSPPLAGAGWPPEGDSFEVGRCLSIVLNEELHHRLFAERDLAVLEQRG
ncbi:MAG TPA: DinB family protein [Frankiaceae bacterium]|nr:DinB family protein [Frankiaceae bacterium]